MGKEPVGQKGRTARAKVLRSEGSCGVKKQDTKRLVQNVEGDGDARQAHRGCLLQDLVAGTGATGELSAARGTTLTFSDSIPVFRALRSSWPGSPGARGWD